MAPQDFFWLEAKEYAERISIYTNERLMKQEVVKLRQGISGRCTVGAGLGGAPFTFGASLVASGYGLRRIHMAHKKRKIIEAELSKRNIKLHEFSTSMTPTPSSRSVLALWVWDWVWACP